MSGGSPIDAYCRAFERLSPETLDDLMALCAANVRFTDPFNDAHGREAYREVLTDMFARAGDPRFEILDVAGGARSRWMLRWRFSARLDRLGDTAFEGASLVVLDAGGLVRLHADYWNAGELYERVPVLGTLIRLLRRRLAAR